MTDLFLVWHAPVELRSSEAGDMEQAVTRPGRARLRRLVRALRHLGIRFDGLHHAPPLGSIETANALSVLLEGESTVTNGLCVTPSDALLAEIAGECVAVVGPEPHLGSIAAWLIHGNADQRDAFVLAPAGVAWLTGELKPGRMRLRALLPPRVLRVLAQ